MDVYYADVRVFYKTFIMNKGDSYHIFRRTEAM